MTRHVLTIVSLVAGMMGSFLLAYDLFGKAVLQRAFIVTVDVVLSFVGATFIALVGWLLFDRGEPLPHALGGSGIRAYFVCVAFVVVVYLGIVLQPAFLKAIGRAKYAYRRPVSVEDEDDTQGFFRSIIRDVNRRRGPLEYDKFLYIAMLHLSNVEMFHARESERSFWRTLVRYTCVTASAILVAISLVCVLGWVALRAIGLSVDLLGLMLVVYGAVATCAAFLVGEILGLVAERLRAEQEQRILGGAGAALTFLAFLIQLLLEVFSP